MYSLIIKSFLSFYLYNLVLCCNDSCKPNAGMEEKLSNTGEEHKKLKKEFKPDKNINMSEFMNKPENINLHSKKKSEYEEVIKKYNPDVNVDEFIWDIMYNYAVGNKKVIEGKFASLEEVISSIFNVVSNVVSKKDLEKEVNNSLPTILQTMKISTKDLMLNDYEIREIFKKNKTTENDFNLEEIKKCFAKRLQKKNFVEVAIKDVNFSKFDITKDLVMKTFLDKDEEFSKEDIINFINGHKKVHQPDSQLNTKENNSETLEKDEKADEVYEEIDGEYGIGSFMDEDDVKAKIKKLGYDKDKVREWVEETLLNNPS